MAGLENLPIYHERQEEGSMMCAQHALNSLLQGNYFSPPDLSEIARNLDLLEESYDDENQGTKSGNMDDSGFFSVQVLDNALKVWGLNLSRWRGEDMRPFHDHPETQLAFILNYEQHWFTLRRFGPHWFNLNSFSEPEWISKLYLGMVLQQAEADGYSVFAVTTADPSAPTLPHTEADDLASTLPEPGSANGPIFQSFTSHNTGGSSVNNQAIQGMEDEDYELQAALQASLMGDVPIELPPPVVHHSIPLPPLSESSSSSSTLDPVSSDIPLDLDPVAATMERNRLLLERMKAEQEYAQRQLWADGELGGAQERDTEVEMIRRAIEESEASARLEGHGSEANPGTAGSEVPSETGMEDIVPSNPQARYGQVRVYDDDDADLRKLKHLVSVLFLTFYLAEAALKASLEQLPEGWTLPEQAAAPESLGRSSTSVASHHSDAVEEPKVEEPADAPPTEDVSVDELRRRRLARFG
ncbi:Josephin-domain-containing protein, partial [Mycena maculata]